jgi:hypothetical protein
MAFVIENEFESSFYNFLKFSDFDCVKIVENIVRYFSGFRDEAIFKG